MPIQIYVIQMHGCMFPFLVLVFQAKWLSGTNVSEMTYFVSGGTQNLNSINHRPTNSAETVSLSLRSKFSLWCTLWEAIYYWITNLRLQHQCVYACATQLYHYTSTTLCLELSTHSFSFHYCYVAKETIINDRVTAGTLYFLCIMLYFC